MSTRGALLTAVAAIAAVVCGVAWAASSEEPDALEQWRVTVSQGAAFEADLAVLRAQVIELEDAEQEELARCRGEL